MIGALPSRLLGEETPEVEWLWSDGARFVEPFFEDTLGRLRREHPANRSGNRPRTSLRALHAMPAGLPVAGLIFHISRCGSTLLARMLAAIPRHLVASEPQILDDLLRLEFPASPITDNERISFLRGAVNALSQPPAGGAERLFIKLDCWHLFSLPLLQRAFPEAPRIFVYRDPLEVLVSLMRRPSLTLVRGTVTPEQLGIASEERDRLSAEEHAAAILGAFFRAALTHRTRLIPIGYEGLPSAALDQLSALEFTATERDQMIAAALQDAKHPTERFVPDSGRKHEVVTPALRAAFDRWTKQPYEQWLASL